VSENINVLKSGFTEKMENSLTRERRECIEILVHIIKYVFAVCSNEPGVLYN
jgi:hypothetical protein